MARDKVEPGEDADDLLPYRALIVGAELLDEREIGCRLGAVALHQRPTVGEQIDPVRRRHQRERLRQQGAAHRPVLDAVIAEIAEIDLDRLAAAPARDLALVLQQQGLGWLPRLRRPDRHRYLPAPGRRIGVVDREALLPQADALLVAGAG